MAELRGLVEAEFGAFGPSRQRRPRVFAPVTGRLTHILRFDRTNAVDLKAVGVDAGGEGA